MVYLASGGFWSMVGQVSVSLSILALSAILARYLTKDAYGEYKYILSIIALLSTLSLSGLSTAVFQSAARGSDGDLVQGFWINIRWSALIFLGALATGAYYLMHGNFVVGVGVLVGGCLSPLIASANMYTSFLAGKKDFARQTIYVAVFGTTLPALALIATALLTRDALAVTLVYFVSNTLLAFYFYWRTLHIYRPDPTLKDTGLLSYSKHLSFIGILGGISANIDSVLLFHYVGAPALAVYAFATGIVDQAKGPLKSLDMMMQARYIGHANKGIRETMRSKMLWLFVLGTLMALVYIPLAPFIYRILFPAYTDAVVYSQVYALSLVGMFLGPAGSYLSAKRKVKEQYWSAIFNSIFQIVALAVGVIWWGLWGLIVARVILRFGGSAFSYLLYKRAVDADPEAI